MKTLQVLAPTDTAVIEILHALGLDAVRIDRASHAYASSFPVEELTVQCRDVSKLDLIFKDLNHERLVPAAVEARPDFIHDPMREIDVYEQVLSPARLGPRYYGKAVDPEIQRHWLFIERVPGIELHQFGDLQVWLEAARWLAKLHGRFAGKETELPKSLLVQDPYSDLRWLRRALAFHPASAPLEGTRALYRVATAYDILVERLAMQPRTFLHGEFYSTNILINQTADENRVVPVDWENAAVGPALLDLAALISGPWRENDRMAIVRAYHESSPAHLSTDFTRLLEDLAWCRLRLAIQWLGWSPTWQPPPEKRHDWLGDVIALAEELDL